MDAGSRSRVAVPAAPRPSGPALSEAERGRATLSLAVLVLRWATLAWMVIVAAVTQDDLRHPVVAWAAVGVTAAWTAWLTVARPGWTLPVLCADLALAVGLVIVSGYVSLPGQLVAGDRPVFATAYPVVAAASWGAARGVGGGLLAGAVLGLALTVARVVNGSGLVDLPTGQTLSLASGLVNFLLVGGGVGLVSRLLERSATELRHALEDSLQAREQAARLAERESLARQIHDSVLQVLAMVHKRGRELAAAGSVPASEVAGLAELAGQQERALRLLVLRAPDAPSVGHASLREALETLAAQVSAVPVEVSAVGPLWLPSGHVDELLAAVRQALDNVARHAEAGSASVYAEQDGGELVVSVRDDGVGFSYDEAALRAAGKIGLLKSMKGRAEQLGGTMTVQTAPGRGTEVEFRVPVDEEAPA